jgi:DNA-binding MarR family transcriptional regulator
VTLLRLNLSDVTSLQPGRLHGRATGLASCAPVRPTAQRDLPARHARPLTLGELGRQLELSHSTVSGIVDRLEAKGVVQCTPKPDDRRSVTVALADRMARTGPPLANDGPAHGLESALASATDDERRRMLDGFALLRRFVVSTSG